MITTRSARAWLMRVLEDSGLPAQLAAGAFVTDLFSDERDRDRASYPAEAVRSIAEAAYLRGFNAAEEHLALKGGTAWQTCGGPDAR